MGAVALTLTSDDLQAIEDAATRITITGARYPESSGRMTGLQSSIIPVTWNRFVIVLQWTMEFVLCAVEGTIYASLPRGYYCIGFKTPMGRFFYSSN